MNHPPHSMFSATAFGEAIVTVLMQLTDLSLFAVVVGCGECVGYGSLFFGNAESGIGDPTDKELH